MDRSPLHNACFYEINLYLSVCKFTVLEKFKMCYRHLHIVPIQIMTTTFELVQGGEH